MISYRIHPISLPITLISDELVL